ncbi:MAG: hypothetical protein CMP09_16095 [Yangia sp.]|nr:hypothetical protein [Salipiger sp.]
MIPSFNEDYRQAQLAMASLKSLVRKVLEAAPEGGLKNAEIGRTLGIYAGHVEHEGHISRSLLEMLRVEGVATQDPDTKKWMLRHHLG